jgi:large subunit ribosomal protein L16
MKFIPKRTKYVKLQKSKIKKTKSKGNKLVFGFYGLKATTTGYLTPKHIETGRRAIRKHIKEEKGQIWIRLFAHVPVTSKPSEIRMGRGKGKVDFWACKVNCGKILYELDNVKEATAIKALTNGAKKLPVKSKIIVGSVFDHS